MSEVIEFTAETSPERTLAANTLIAISASAEVDGKTVPCSCVMTLLKIEAGKDPVEVGQYIGSDGSVYNWDGGLIRIEVVPSVTPCVGTLRIG
jgi:hypothetical protein